MKTMCVGMTIKMTMTIIIAGRDENCGDDAIDRSWIKLKIWPHSDVL